ncbi:MAG TPA: TetR/AcrR family transcriptional regulator [Tepidisphaeraceae bacterium]|nr:TetR/AcrR family transcriptional regulator [Tepidisphaeraceae bacterium]
MGRVSDAKDRLLEAAIKLVWRNSYGAVSVEDICNEAGVKKGSFYHFFPGKNELVAAAFRHYWAGLRPQFDQIFSASVPPIERLRGFFAEVRRKQKLLRDDAGFVLGCPFASIGTELIAPGTDDGGLRAAIQELVRGKVCYIETALRDAMAEGSVPKGNVRALAKTLYLYLEGAAAQARIQNDLSLLDDIEENGLRLIGYQPVLVSL